MPRKLKVWNQACDAWRGVAGMGCGCGLNGRLQKMDQLVCDSEGATVQVRQCHEKPSPSLQTPL